MPPKQKTCPEEVRSAVTGIREPCGTSFSDDECPRRRLEHIRNLKTGHCHTGWCEGLKPKGPVSGNPCPTCKQWLTCPCDCHDLVSMMFKVNSLPRVTMENPEYIPFHMPSMMSLDERAQAIAARKEEDREQRRVLQQLQDGGDDIHSPSGRTRKGLLDQWVEFACKMWAINPSIDCTPAWISDTVAMINQVPAPSVGAVDAVLKRWKAYGFAMVEEKPVRFTGFTTDGTRLGLSALKERHRMQVRKMEMARGRPR